MLLVALMPAIVQVFTEVVVLAFQLMPQFPFFMMNRKIFSLNRCIALVGITKEGDETNNYQKNDPFHTMWVLAV